MSNRAVIEFDLGAHNLHDDAGIPTFFAHVVLFTEAIAPTILAKARQKVAHAKARLAGYAVITCHEQRDLVIAYRRRMFKIVGRSYTQYVKGWAKVSPNRGTFVVFLRHRETGVVVPALVEHRINAAFPPYVRSEGAPKETEFRKDMWRKHTDGTLGTAAALEKQGYQLLVAGGDDNVPTNVHAYAGQLNEVGPGKIHFDRLACSQRIDHFEVLSVENSDHHRVRAHVRGLVTVGPKAA